jgi:GNAT superfamily N-acetyltransferase
MSQPVDLPMDERIENAQRNYFWLPAEAKVVQRDEIDYVTTPSRPDRQHNIVTRLRAAAREYPRLLAEVLRAHEGLPSAWNLGCPSWDASLERLLDKADFSLRASADAYSLPVDVERRLGPDHIRIERVASAEGILTQQDVMARSFPQVTPLQPDDAARYLQHCTGPNAPVERFTAFDRQSGEALAVGAMTVYRAEKLGFFWGGCSIPTARGRGVYSALVTRRLQRARELGLRWVALYALKATSGPIVAKQGFQQHGQVRFWLREHAKDTPPEEPNASEDSGAPRG